MDWNVLEWIGMDWNGLEWIGMEWNGMEWTRRSEQNIMVKNFAFSFILRSRDSQSMFRRMAVASDERNNERCPNQ
jgi:hypothetical protein